MPEYMLYMNAVGSFLKPGLVEQKTETPKTDSPETKNMYKEHVMFVKPIEQLVAIFLIYFLNPLL